MSIPIQKPQPPPESLPSTDESQRRDDSPFTPPPELQTDIERGTGELGTEGSDLSKPLHGTDD